MSITRCWHLILLILFGFLYTIPLAHASAASYSQIVRISYVQGDVRISRGKKNEKNTGAGWETAVADLPVESGFNLVTGAGCAEIEFEDTSTVYIGENSVLAFNDLQTKGSVPYTEIALLSGTATVHARLTTPGEFFVLTTPTNALSLKYPDDSFVRVNSYLDGMTVTPQENMITHLPGDQTVELTKCRMTSYVVNGQIPLEASVDRGALTEWDNWVANRVAIRTAETAGVMKASGLTTPIPGLAEMAGQGKFFPCEPYGTCWEPNNLPDQQAGGGPYDAQQTGTLVSGPASPLAQQLQQKGGAAVSAAGGTFERDFYFPCPPTRIRSMITRDPVTGRKRVVSSTMAVGTEPYDWAVCHAGSWIYRGHRYTWVARNRRHHHCPVHWIKAGHTLAYVPIHPDDVLGKPPLNRVHGVFVIRDQKGGAQVEWSRLESGSDVSVLRSTPKEFRTANLMPLTHAAEPVLDAHRMGDRGLGVKEASIRIAFDHKSQSFLIARQGLDGSRSTAGLQAFNGRMGSIQGHGEGFGGGAGHGFGGGFSGGPSHGSGGGSAGGGASHGGGKP